MLSAQDNELLTEVGPGTPMGELLRRYWHPIAATSELADDAKEVRILGEDLVLYRDKRGTYGLIAPTCPHRRVSLALGVPEEGGLRCAYHGWKFDATGQCIEQPYEQTEDPTSTFKDRVKITAYPVQELAGLVFAYLGPDPAPLLPRWDLLVRQDVTRTIGVAVLPCNWLQVMENSLDPIHGEWLHGVFNKHVQDKLGRPLDEPSRQLLRKHEKIGFSEFEYGVIKRRVLEGGTEEDDDWAIGHPMIFPNLLRVGGGLKHSFQWRVPMDDTHTYHVWYTCYVQQGADVATDAGDIPFFEVPIRDDRGRFIVDTVNGQDIAMWVTQGPVADRTLEKLGLSDKGIILYRQMLREQLERVAEGEEPMNVFRDPAQNVCIELPQERDKLGLGADTTMPGLEYFRHGALRNEEHVDVAALPKAEVEYRTDHLVAARL